MSANTLCFALRRLNIAVNSTRRYSAQLVKDQKLVQPSVALWSKGAFTSVPESASQVQVKFAPRSLSVDFGVPVNDGLRRSIIESPFKGIPSIGEVPTGTRIVYEDLPLIGNESLDLPTVERTPNEKQATRLIVIRRKKMKKHKRRKLRKKMSIIWSKIRLRRSIKREKEFQAELLAKIRTAEKFDARSYVEQRLKHLHKEYLPLTYRGEVLPRETIRKFIKEKEERLKARQNKPNITL